MPPKTIAVAATQRSGSNFLGDLMAQTGQLGRPAEYFNARYITGSASYPVQCQLAVEKGKSSNGVVAIKLFPAHFRNLESHLRFSAWFGAPTWVWLRRRDLLGQAISLELARQRQTYASGVVAVREAVYATERLLARIDDIVTANAAWEAYFARTGIVPAAIWYEDVEADPIAAVASVAAAAGIELSPTRLDPNARFQRQRDELNETWRQRFIAEAGDVDVLAMRMPSSPWRRLRRWAGRHLRQLVRSRP